MLPRATGHAFSPHGRGAAHILQPRAFRVVIAPANPAEHGRSPRTAGGYLKAAGIAFRPPGGWGRRPPAKPANEVITDFGAELSVEAQTAPTPPANRSPSASACVSYREAIELGMSRGRNAMAIWQDLVDTNGFAGGYQSVFNSRRARLVVPGLVDECNVRVPSPSVRP